MSLIHHLSRRGSYLVAAALICFAAPIAAQIDLATEQVLFEGGGLSATRVVALPPDEAHVYSASSDYDCVVASARDAITGELNIVQTLCESQADVEGVNAKDFAFSPGGEHLYIAADGLTLAHRDAASGRLTLGTILLSGEDDNQGISFPNGIVLSADGNFLYATSSVDEAVSVYERDAISGELSFTQVLFQGEDGVTGLEAALALALSPGGEHLYVTSGLFSDDVGAISVFSRNATSGELTFVETLFDDQNGIDGLDGPDGLAVSPSGDHLYVAAEDDDAISIFSRNTSTGKLTFVGAVFDEQNGITLLGSTDNVAVRPDGEVVVARGENAFVVFDRDTTNGTLTLVEEGTNASLSAEGIASLRQLKFTSDGSQLYAAAGGPDTEGGIVVLDSAPMSGAHSFVQYLGATAQQSGMEGVGRMALSGDGEHLYGTGFDSEAVIVWERDPASGRLTFIEAVRADGTMPSSLEDAEPLALSPDGQHLYVGADDDFMVFERNAVDGTLTFASEFTFSQDSRVSDIAISADGLFLYVAFGRSTSFLHTYSRDPSTGTLTLEQELPSGVDGDFGWPTALRLDPTETHLYASGQRNSAGIAIYSRDSITGLLTFVDQFGDTVGETDFIDAAFDLNFSADGSHVYAAYRDQDAVSHLTRNPTTGLLTLVETFFDGVNGAEGLNGVNSIALSPSGRLLITGSEVDDAVALFLRDPVDGTLSYSGLVTRGVDGSSTGMGMVLASSDGSVLYEADDEADAITVFRMPRVVFADGFESGGTSRWSSSVP